MDITIVVVSYRSAVLTADLLTSISRQSRGWVGRVIVVDNASGDGSVEALRKSVAVLGMDEWVEVVEAGRNGGFGAGNNLGAAVALRAEQRPGVLWFLNPDTLVDAVDLAHVTAWFENDPRVAIVGTSMHSGDGKIDGGGHRELTPLSEFVRTGGAFKVLRGHAVTGPELNRPGPVGWVSGASMFIRTDAFERLGGFDEGFFLYFEEVDLCRRARDMGDLVIYEPRACIVHLEGRSTGVAKAKPRPWYWYESRSRYFTKHYGALGLMRADLFWIFGRTVRALRRQGRDDCRGPDLLRCDLRALLGRSRTLGATRG